MTGFGSWIPVEGLDDVDEMIRTDKEYPERRLRSVMDDLANGCGTYIRLCKGGAQGGAGSVGRTKLDRERHRMCLRVIERVQQAANAIRKVKKWFKVEKF